jgi:hypothetical protein
MGELSDRSYRSRYSPVKRIGWNMLKMVPSVWIRRPPKMRIDYTITENMPQVLFYNLFSTFFMPSPVAAVRKRSKRLFQKTSRAASRLIPSKMGEKRMLICYINLFLTHDPSGGSTRPSGPMDFLDENR